MCVSIFLPSGIIELAEALPGHQSEPEFNLLPKYLFYISVYFEAFYSPRESGS